MRKTFMTAMALAAATAIADTTLAAGIVRITEFSSNDGGSGTGEWIEYTNVGDAPIDMTGWSHSDSDQGPGNVPFGAVFGTVQPGESVIFCEILPDTFRTLWNLPGDIRIFGPNGKDNLSSGADMINLYDASFSLVDTLTYSAGETTNGSGITFSRNRPLGGTGQSPNMLWINSSVGDSFGSFSPSGTFTGNPGSYVPEPASLSLVVLGGAALAIRRRRHN